MSRPEKDAARPAGSAEQASSRSSQAEDWCAAVEAQSRPYVLSREEAAEFANRWVAEIEQIGGGVEIVWRDLVMGDALRLEEIARRWDRLLVRDPSRSWLLEDLWKWIFDKPAQIEAIRAFGPPALLPLADELQLVVDAQNAAVVAFEADREARSAVARAEKAMAGGQR